MVVPYAEPEAGAYTAPLTGLEGVMKALKDFQSVVKHLDVCLQS